ncbi:hypothetical protein ACQKP0_24645 [Heyndrickxia sp. NPDC080065]|uniref:hypothetical protein n=1 Tax=Heyndrickxia sp. NPDC080065 TaxID=3390568 RepID=UPI003CFDE601
MNGFIGWSRAVIGGMATILTVILLFIVISFVYFLFFHTISFIFFIGTIVFINLLVYFYIKIKGDYHVRAIKISEVNNLIGKRLIHYTNFINKDEFHRYKNTGFIKLFGNDRARANYRMRYKDKKKNFIWFHIENESKNGEPSFSSFMQAHYGESRPRKYKVIIEFNDIVNEKLYINPANGNILICAESIYVKAKVYEKFNWYQKKIYIKWALLSSICDPFYMIPVVYHQLVGIVLDKIKK